LTEFFCFNIFGTKFATSINRKVSYEKDNTVLVIDTNLSFDSQMMMPTQQASGLSLEFIMDL
jgi:hypothetical protein